MDLNAQHHDIPLVLEESSWPSETTHSVYESTVGSVLRQAAAAAPDQVGLIAAWPGQPIRKWTYAQLLDEAEQTAQALLIRFEPGERVAVWAPNIPEWLFVQYGAALAGLTLVPINPALQARELAYILRQSRAAGLFLVPEYRGHPMAAILDEIQADIPDLREVILFTDRSGFRTSTKRITPLPQVRADYPAQIQYTSGTTGAPKGAILHHRGLTNNARFIAGRLGARTGDVWGNPNPLFHVSGSGFCNLGAMQSLSVQLLCSFDPALLVALVEQERATLLSLPPTVLNALLRQAIGKAHDLSSLRAVNTGGMTVPAELVRHAEEVLSVPVLIGYGQTEACGLVLHTALDDSPAVRAETLGRPLPQIAVRIADPQSGATVPLGEIGELCVRGYTVMTGYLDQPEATAAAIDTEGWLHTGDLGTMDSRGYCRIVDRLKDMIIRGGENIYPREIEDLLEQHPAVAAAAVIGMPDGRYGEAVVACIQPAVGHTINERELQTYCRARLAAYKVPQRWIILEELPRTPLGKIQKFALRTLV